MNFLKYGFVVLAIFAISCGQAEAGRIRNIGANGGRRVGGASQRVQPHAQRIGQGVSRVAHHTVQGIPIAADVAEVADAIDYFANQYGR